MKLRELLESIGVAPGKKTEEDYNELQAKLEQIERKTKAYLADPNIDRENVVVDEQHPDFWDRMYWAAHSAAEFRAEDAGLPPLHELLGECEVVYVSERGQILTEAAQRAFKREGKKIVRKYRCTTGMKEGKIVADPKSCATRKDPAKIRHGRKVARQKKGVRLRKAKITKRQTMSKMVTRMNKRLTGK